MNDLGLSKIMLDLCEYIPLDVKSKGDKLLKKLDEEKKYYEETWLKRPDDELIDDFEWLDTIKKE